MSKSRYATPRDRSNIISIPHGTSNGYRHYKCRCEPCVKAQSTVHKKWITENYEYSLEYARQKHKSAYKLLRVATLTALGGACVSCDNDDVRVLQIDHINGDGKADRASYNGRIDGMLRNIIELGHQDKYQVLCANCHVLKTHHGLVVKRKRKRKTKDL